MLHIGITGQAGFIGTHLYNFFGLKKEEVIRIPFEDSYFDHTDKLEDKAGSWSGEKSHNPCGDPGNDHRAGHARGGQEQLPGGDSKRG